MSESHGDRPAEKQGSGEQSEHKKRRYVKPAFQQEKVFETMALSCGKISATERQCHFNRKNS
jgi:hypothetical protein